MARRTQLDRAIEKLDADIAILVAARDRLIAQRDQADAAKAKRDGEQP